MPDLFAPHVALAQAAQASLTEGWLALFLARQNGSLSPEATQAATSAQRLAHVLRQRLEHLAGHLSLDAPARPEKVVDATTRGSGH